MDGLLDFSFNVHGLPVKEISTYLYFLCLFLLNYLLGLPVLKKNYPGVLFQNLKICKIVLCFEFELDSTV